MHVYRIATVDSPVSPRDCWGVFDDSGRRVCGPANLLDCTRARNDIIERERRGELDFRALLADDGIREGAALLAERLATA